jgi:1-acyl-sn-glycerol-3-phosphate acyltransferase
VEVSGYENVPPTGNYVIATNHLGILDFAMLYYALDDWNAFIPVGEKWERIAFLRWLGRYLNFVFIDRFNPDIKALRRIIALMEDGNNLVIAPEGTRSRAGSMGEGKLGVSYLAARLNRPILPVALAGTDDAIVLANLRRLRRTRIVVRAGAAFHLPPLPRENREASLRQFTDEIMCRIAVMLPPKYHGFYADHPRLKQLLKEAAASPG